MLPPTAAFTYFAPRNASSRVREGAVDGRRGVPEPCSVGGEVHMRRGGCTYGTGYAARHKSRAAQERACLQEGPDSRQTARTQAFNPL
jgi:hypothetical protein